MRVSIYSGDCYAEWVGGGGGRKGCTSVTRRVAAASFKLISTKKNICAVYSGHRNI